MDEEKLSLSPVGGSKTQILAVSLFAAGMVAISLYLYLCGKETRKPGEYLKVTWVQDSANGVIRV